MQPRRWLFWIVLAALALRIAAWLYFRGHLLELVTMRLPDDALYYFTIARNLASGYGISFDGIHPTNGMHPLWLFVLAPIFFFHLSNWGSIHAALLLQSLLDVITVWLIGLTVYESLPNASESNRHTAAAISAAIYALSTLALLRGINGMETTLAALFFVLWFRAYLRVIKNSQWATWMWLGIVTGLLLLARTDSFIVLIPISLSLILTRWNGEWKRMLLALFVACIVIAPWIIWNVVTFGTIMQSSGEAVPMLAFRKLHALYGTFILGHLLVPAIRNALKPFWYLAFGLPLLTIGYAIFTRRKKFANEEKAIYWLMLGGILLLLFHSFFRGFIRDWYVEALIPLFMIGFGISIGANAGKTEARTSGRWALAAVVILFQVILFWKSQYRSQTVIFQSGITMAQDLSLHGKIAAFNSGYDGYFARRGSIVDLDGVVNNDALAALQSGTLGHYLAQDSVSYILDFRGDFGGYQNLFDHHLLDDYRLDSVIANPYEREPLVLYRRK